MGLAWPIWIHGQGGAAVAKTAITEEDLMQRTRELYRGVDTGDPAAWKKYFADDCLYFDEKGRAMTKAALVADITGFPPGYSGHLRLAAAKSLIEGNVAILSFDMDEQETIFGQDMTARYHETDTWMLRKGEWQIVAGQVLRYYEDPATGKAESAKFADYAGTYELAPGKQATVSAEGGRLYYQKSESRPGDGKKVELLPESDPVYFRKGVEGRMLFRRDDSGKVIALVDRRNNEDVVWKKVG
jgi:Domain of unknown function (DUF4440)/Domain of unknown function (DUF3471)